jgi:hypothetical protein
MLGAIFGFFIGGIFGFFMCAALVVASEDDDTGVKK